MFLMHYVKENWFYIITRIVLQPRIIFFLENLFLKNMMSLDSVQMSYIKTSVIFCCTFFWVLNRYWVYWDAFFFSFILILFKRSPKGFINSFLGVIFRGHSQGRVVISIFDGTGKCCMPTSWLLWVLSPLWDK